MTRFLAHSWLEWFKDHSWRSTSPKLKREFWIQDTDLEVQIILVIDKMLGALANAKRKQWMLGKKHLILRSRHRGTWNQVVVELNHELEEHDALKKKGKCIFKGRKYWLTKSGNACHNN